MLKDGSGLPDLHHIAMVVKNRDRALAGAETAFGFGRWFKADGGFRQRGCRAA